METETTIFLPPCEERTGKELGRGLFLLRHRDYAKTPAHAGRTNQTKARKVSFERFEGISGYFRLFQAI